MKFRVISWIVPLSSSFAEPRRKKENCASQFFGNLLGEVDYLSHRQPLRQAIEAEVDFIEPQAVRV